MDIDPLPNSILPLFCALDAGGAVAFGASQIVALTVAVLCLFVSAFVSGSEIAFFFHYATAGRRAGGVIA